MDNRIDSPSHEQMEEHGFDNENVDSDHQSVDSAQLLAEITDVLNSYSDATHGGFFGENDIKTEEKDQSDDKSLESVVTQDVEVMGKCEAWLSEGDRQIERTHVPHISSDMKPVKNTFNNKESPTGETSSTCISEKKVISDVTPMKQAIVLLQRLDPSLTSYKIKSSNTQSLSLETQLTTGSKKSHKNTDLKKSVWYDEDGPLSDISVSDGEEIITNASKTISNSGTSNLKTKCQERDNIFKVHEKIGHLRIDYKDISSEKLKDRTSVAGSSHISATKSKSSHSNSSGSFSHMRKSGTHISGGKINNPIDKSKMNEICSKYMGGKKMTEKSRTHVFPDSRKRKLSKDDRCIEVIAHSFEKSHTKKTDEKYQSDWRYELQIYPFGMDDLNNEAFRKFINLASDCAINFASSSYNGCSQGHVHLYFGCASNMQSGMQKLSQLSLMSPKILYGIIKCHHIKPTTTTGKESDVKWRSAEEIKLGFSMFSSWTEKVKQLVQVKDWKRDDGSKRKCAQIQRIPPFLSREMISLLFPFSLNVHIPKPKIGAQKNDSHGYTEIEFENTALMETVLSCFRNFYVVQVGIGNTVNKLPIINFEPPTEKIPEQSVTAYQPNLKSKDLHSYQKNVLSKDSHESRLVRENHDFQGRSHKSRRFDGYTAKMMETSGSSSHKGDIRKRPFPESGDMIMRDAECQKKSKIGRESTVARSLSQTDDLTSQTAANDKSKLKLLAQSKGLDHNNADIIRILEMQNHLSSLQALFSTSNKTASHPGQKTHALGTDRERVGSEFNTQSTSKESISYSEAEQQLRENIAMKQKQLKVLEEKFKLKKGVHKVSPGSASSKSISPGKHSGVSLNPMNESENSLLPSRNNQPLDFTKPVPKIEEAMKEDEERSKLFAFKSSTPSIPSQHQQGRKNKSTESKISTEDFALPLQFGKNVKKAPTELIANKTKTQNFHKPYNRQSPTLSRDRKQTGILIPSMNNTFNETRTKEKFNNRTHEDRVWGGVKEKPFPIGSAHRQTFEYDRPFTKGGSVHDSFISGAEWPNESASGDYGSGKSNDSHLQMNFSHEETDDRFYSFREFPESMPRPGRKGIETVSRGVGKTDYTMNKSTSYERMELNNYENYPDERPTIHSKVFNEHFGQGQGDLRGRHQSDESMKRNYFDGSDFSEEIVYPERQGFLKRNMNQTEDSRTDPSTNQRNLYEEKHHMEKWHRGSYNDDYKPPGDVGMQGRGVEPLRGAYTRGRGQPQGYIGMRGKGMDRQRGILEDPQKDHATRGEMESFVGFGMRERGATSQRGSDMNEQDWVSGNVTTMNERDVELQRSTGIRGRGMGPQRGTGMRRGGMEPQRGTGMRGGSLDLEPQIGTERSGRDMEPQRGTGMRSRGMEPPSGRGMRGRGMEPPSGRGMRGRGMEPPSGTGMRGRGMEPRIGTGMRGRGMEPRIGTGMRGRSLDLEPQRGLGMNERDIEPLIGTEWSGRDMEPQRGTGMRGRGIEPQRGTGMRGRGMEPQRGTRGKGIEPHFERGIKLQRGLGMSERDVEPDISTERSGSDMEPQRGTGMRGRGMEPQRRTGMRGRGMEPQTRGGTGMRGRGMEPQRGGGLEPQSGTGIRGRGMEPQRGTGMRGRGMESQRGRGLEPQSGTGMRGRGMEPQTGTGMRGRGMEPQRGGGLERQSGTGIRGRGMEPQGSSFISRERGFQNDESLPYSNRSETTTNTWNQFEYNSNDNSYSESESNQERIGLASTGRGPPRDLTEEGNGPSEPKRFKDAISQRGRGREMEVKRGRGRGMEVTKGRAVPSRRNNSEPNTYTAISSNSGWDNPQRQGSEQESFERQPSGQFEANRSTNTNMTRGGGVGRGFEGVNRDFLSPQGRGAGRGFESLPVGGGRRGAGRAFSSSQRAARGGGLGRGVGSPQSQNVSLGYEARWQDEHRGDYAERGNPKFGQAMMAGNNARGSGRGVARGGRGQARGLNRPGVLR